MGDLEDKTSKAIADYRSAARMKLSTSMEDSPDSAARALELEKNTGWPATATVGDIDNYEADYKSKLASELIRNNLHLQSFINAKPLNAGLIHDDIANLDYLSEAIEKVPKDPVEELFKGFYRGFDFESEPGTWQQQYPEWKSLQDKGSLLSAAATVAALPIELPIRTFTGVIEGLKSSFEASYQWLGGSETQAKKFSADSAGMIENYLMGLTGVHRAALPQETIKTLEDFSKTKVWAEAGKVPPVGVSKELDKLRGEQTKQDLKNLDELVKLVQATELHKRSPESLLDFIKLHPKIKDENVYISGEAVQKLYGDKPPKPDDNILGWVPDIEAQLAAGGDVQIPLDLWTVKVEAELAKELREYTKLRPDGVTLDEIKNAPKEGEEGETWYHGSPSTDISQFQGRHAYFTQDKQIAEDYAKKGLLGSQTGHVGEKKPTVYTVNVNAGKPFDLRIPEHRELYNQLREEYNKTAEPEERLPKLTTEGFIQSDGLPSFGNARTIIDNLPSEFKSMLVSEGSQGTSLLVRKPGENTTIKERTPVGGQTPLMQAASRITESQIIPVTNLMGKTTQISILFNPTKAQLGKVLRESEAAVPHIRAIKDLEGNWYAWEGNEGLHADVARALGIKHNLGYGPENNSYTFDKKTLKNFSTIKSALMQAVIGYRKAAGVYIQEVLNEKYNVTAEVKPTELWTKKEKVFFDKMNQLLEKLAPNMVEGKQVESIKFGEDRATGAYIPREGAYPLIVWAMRDDAAHTIRHEITHHLKRFGFFTEEEWKTAEEASEEKGWIAKHSIDLRYPGEGRELKIEESVAEEFAQWATERSEAHPLAKIFQKIWDLIQGIKIAVKETFGQKLSIEDIFRKMESGEIGGREDNEPLAGIYRPEAQKEEDAAFQAKHDEEQRKKQSSKEWKDAASAMRGDAERAVLGRPDVQVDLRLRELGERKLSPEVMDQIAELFGYQTRNEMLDEIYALREDRGAEPPEEYLERLITDETNRMVGKKLNDPEALLESAKDHVISTSAQTLHYELARIMAAKSKEKLRSKKEMKQEAADKVAALPLKMINSDKFLAEAGRTTRVKDNLQNREAQLVKIYMAQEARKYEKAQESYEGIVKAHSGLKPKDIDIPHGLFIQQTLARLGEKIKRTEEDLAEEIAHNESGYKDINAFEHGKKTTEFKSINLGENLRKPDFKTDDIEKLSGKDFLDVLNGLRSLVKSGRQDFKIEVRGKNADAAQVIGNIADQIREQDPQKILTNPGPARKFFGGIKTIILGVRQVEALIDMIEKGNPFGDFTQAIIRPMSEASGMLDHYLKKGAKVITGLPLKQSDLEAKIENKLIHEPDTIGSVIGTQFKDMRQKNLLAFILNMGEAKNRKALLEGYGISTQQALAFIKKHASKEMMEAAEQIWEWQEDIKKQRDEMFRREGDWVEPQPIPMEIETDHGIYTGGGVPLLYDARYEKSKILGPGAIEGAHYDNAQMGPSQPLPVSLDFDRLILHTTGALRDLALRPTLRQIARIFRDEEFRKAVRNHLGPEFNDAFDKWLFDLANSRNIDTRMESALTHVSDFTRSSLASYLVGFNLNTVEKHGLTAGLQSISRSIETLGPIKGPLVFLKDFAVIAKDFAVDYTLGKKYGENLFSKEFANEFNTMFKNPDIGDSNLNFAMIESYELPRRMHGISETLGGAVQGFGKKLSWRQLIIDWGSKPIALFDLATAVPLWISEFRAAQDKGLSKGDAVFIADRAVRNAHGSTADFTKPQFMRGSSVSKWMMTFYGFFNHMLQRNFEIGWRSGEMYGYLKEGDYAKASKEFGTVFNLFMFYTIAPALVEGYVAQELYGSATKDEGYLHRLGKLMLMAGSGTLPIVRDLVHAVVGHADANIGLAGTMAKNLTTPVVDLSKGKVFSTQKATEKFVKDLGVAVGSVTGVLPSAGIRGAWFLRDVVKGKEKPSGFVEWERGLQTGHAKPPKK